MGTFNLVWPSCQLSESWLWAAIVPIPKPEKTPQELRNLRPIALTSTLCTLLERILATRLRWWIDTLHWYRPAQIGFRPHPGTEHGLEYLSFMVFVGGHSRHVRPVQGVCKNICMDICKACDNVSHAAILQVLCCPDIFFNTVQSFCNASMAEAWLVCSSPPRTTRLCLSPLLLTLYCKLGPFPLSKACIS